MVDIICSRFSKQTDEQFGCNAANMPFPVHKCTSSGGHSCWFANAQDDATSTCHALILMCVCWPIRSTSTKDLIFERAMRDICVMLDITFR